jgi:polyprenyl-phospho-N-acetylgalactosaminyl synthase
VPETWVVIPLYNEAAVIGAVVRQVLEGFAPGPAAVVCVDDGSTDGSGAQARAAGAVVVRHAMNLGQGAALQTGISYAVSDPQMRYLVTFDADGQHQVSDAMAMVEVLRRQPIDVVFGSRFLDQGGPSQPATRPGPLKRALLKSAVVYSNLSTRVRLTDAHNGLRAFNRKAAEGLRIRQDRMAHASEIVSQVGRLGLRWAEQPVHILYTDYSRAKGQSSLNAVNIVVDLLFK